jgi:alkanesulfonate monooxygenase SsuD/methylene tetrahydromethanopterin reductase-like flavin-dependent oxidoreductase (luciferase family)
LNSSRDITFAFQCSTATAADEPKSDQVLYNEVIEDCRLGYELGYEAAWMNEHHCSDYFPTPSPLLLFAAVAREVPDLGLGTMVLVLPWYHPLRLAGELSMLNQLTRGKLHIGLGRGTAKFEYDAFGVAMPEARERFAEGVGRREVRTSGKVLLATTCARTAAAPERQGNQFLWRHRQPAECGHHG